MINEKKNDALEAEQTYKTAVESANDYIENFDILETITNVGNDEVFTPRKTCDMMLDSLPDEVWHNPNYRWLNPATKNGIFEREIAIRLDEGLKDVIPDQEKRRKHILQNMIHAIGQTKFTANVARRTLYYCSSANRACDGILAEDGHYVNGYAIGNGTWFKTEEGNIKTPNTVHTFDPKTKKCKYCGISYDSRYVDEKQREQYAYEFLHVYHLVLGKHLGKRFGNGETNMKFDIIIGNPPYQLSTNDKGIQAIPIYHSFVRQAISLSPKYLSMIIPSRWFTGGIGMDQFRDEMLKDKRIKMLHDFPKSRDCFPTVDIAGGVCYFLWDRDYNGPCEVISQTGEDIITSIRPLDEYPVFIRDNIGVQIVDKIFKKTNKTLDSRVSSISPFALPTNTKGVDKPFPGSVKLIASSGEFYIERSKITKGAELIDKFKVSIGQLNPDRGGVNNSSDGMSNVTTKVKIYKPGEVFTATYLLLGSFDTLQEAENYASFIKTRFVRYLVFLTLSSMHITKDNFRFVPESDYSKKAIEKDLYSYYELTDKEISSIETLIREMN
jgi:site-specific DNA-methyltransferase (adenine-specific)